MHSANGEVVQSGGGGCGKVRCPKFGGGSVLCAEAREKGVGTAVSLLLQICVVLLALLLIAGDVERNPGPTGKEGSDQVDKVFPTVDDSPLVPLYDPPKIEELVTVMKTVGDWYTMGLRLGMTTQNLDSLKTIQGANQQKAEMFKIWMDELRDKGEGPTWQHILEVLKELGIKNPVQIIERRYRPNEIRPPPEPRVRKLGDVPKLEELMCLRSKDGKTKVKVIETVAAIWTKVANLLDINSSIVHQLECDHRRVADACQNMFEKRLDTEEFHEPLTWGMVIDVLKDCDLNVTAMELQTLLSEGAIASTPQTSKPPFGCGCGKCTFYSYIESGCPNPIPSASTFPYLDFSRLTREQQQQLRARLRVESNGIMIKFQHLFSTVYESLCARCIPVDELVTHLLPLGVFDPVYQDSQKPVFQTFCKELQTAGSIEKVLLCIREYFSFFDYHVIEHIVSELGTDQDKAELQKYKVEFGQYAKRRIYECLPEFGPVSETGHADIIFVVDSCYEKFTVEEVHHLQYQVGRLLGLKSLRLCQLEKGKGWPISERVDSNDSEPPVVATPTTISPEQQSFSTKSMLLFEEAMKQGHIEVCIIKCLLFGTAGVGKTCLLHLLLDMLPPTLRQSTACIEQAIRVCTKYGIDSEGKWVKVDSDGLRDHLAGSVSKEAKNRGPLPANGASLLHDHGGATHHDHGGATHHDRGEATHHDHGGATRHDHGEATHHDYGGATPHDHKGATLSTGPHSNTMEDILKRAEEVPELGKLEDMTWVYLVDSGGQPQFHELLTAFVQNVSLGIFVHKLSERLDDHPLIKYFDKEGEQCGKGYHSFLTNRDVFQQCIQTVQSLTYTTTAEDSNCPQLATVGTHREEEHQCKSESRDDEKKKKKLLPWLAIVGTHRDEEHQCKGESRDDKNKQLLEILPQKISKKVFKRTGMQEVIYPVNAKSPVSDDRHIANQLRVKIKKLKPPTEKLPLKWYGLELELEKEAVERKRWVFTKNECILVAKRLHFPSEEALDAALQHLDKLNIFLYYPSVLPQLVFCSPCVLLDKISELVEESHRLKQDPDPNALNEGELSTFCDQGLVTAQLLKDYPKHYTEFFTSAHLLKLFESLLIVVPIDSDTYLMPSLLDMRKQSEFHRPSDCPLVIFFEDGCAPLGLFSSLIAFLLSDKNKRKLSDKNEPKPWTISIDNPKLYRNHITFSVFPGSVTLIDYASFFEVHVTISSSLSSHYKDTCRYVSHTIVMGIEEAIKARNFKNVCYQKAISCQCKKHHHNHPALLKTSKEWKCTRSDEWGNLDERNLVWVENPTDTKTYGAGFSPTEGRSPPTEHRKKEMATQDTPVELKSSRTKEGSPPTKRRREPTTTEDTPIELIQKSIKLRDVYEELINISHKWFDLGLRLELEEGKLEAIELANPNKPQHCLRAMLSTWLKQDSRPTWQFLCAALRSKTVGENELANIIEAKYT